MAVTTTEPSRAKIRMGFIGGGQMATALAKGALASGLVDAGSMGFSEPNRAQVAKLKETFAGVRCLESEALSREMDVLVLAIKPQVLVQEWHRLRGLVETRHLVLSVVAGVSLGELSERLGTEKVIRIMPNTPCQISEGAFGMAVGVGVNGSDVGWVRSWLEGLGVVEEISDEQMHAVTGLSGSGPAYVFAMLEGMADGGVAAGLPRDVAMRLAIQTVLGSAKLCQQTGLHPGVLKDQVTSPAGTTIAGLRQLEAAGMRSAFLEAVVAASHRSRELGNAAK